MRRVPFFWLINQIFMVLFILCPSAARAQGADAPAAAFQLKCAACHTVGGGKITDAPDLIIVSTWPRTDLSAAIKRMEKNVGPLDDAAIASFTDLLLAADVRARLTAEQQRRLRQLAASVAPGDPAAGRQLFQGDRRLANGGLPCASCHAVAGAGGSFAVDLSGVFARRGQSGLMASIQGANFPVMQAAYRAHPITAQEATNLTEYFKAANAGGVPASSPPPMGAVGLALAAVGGVGLAIRGRGRAAGTRARLVDRATARTSGRRPS